MSNFLLENWQTPELAMFSRIGNYSKSTTHIYNLNTFRD